MKSNTPEQSKKPLSFRPDVMSDSDVHDLMAAADFLDVSREELDAFDASSFEASDVQVPPDIGDPKNIAERLDALVRRESGAVVENESTDPSLFVGCNLDEGLVDDASAARIDVDSHDNRFTELVPLVIQAYLDVRFNRSTDFLVAEPELNLRFLQRCWQLGAAATPQELNWTLVTARKDGHLRGLPRAQAFSIPRERLDQFSFASEIALRHLQDRAYYDEQRELSLDKVLCDPALAAEFDATARRLAPGYSSLDYRWAAMTLRKARRWAAELRLPSFDDLGLAHNLRSSRITTNSGLFWFQVGDRSAFVGVAENLRVQIDQYLGAVGPRVIPEWWVHRPPTRIARVYVAEMPRTNLAQREKYRSVVLSKRTSQLNFLNGPLFEDAA